MVTPKILIQKLLEPFGIEIENIEDICGVEISRNKLLDESVYEKYDLLIPEVKKLYKTSKLTTLHSNAKQKQKCLPINLLRQVLKCNNYRLKPKSISTGYCKLTGKKNFKRSFVIINNQAIDLDDIKEITA